MSLFFFFDEIDKTRTLECLCLRVIKEEKYEEEIAREMELHVVNKISEC